MKSHNTLPVQLFAACLVGLLLGKFCFSTTKDKVELSLFNGKPSKLQSVMNIIENRYVDQLDLDSLTELVIYDVMGHLDPHTSYTPMKKRSESDKNIVGKFCGVGIEYNLFNDTIEILSVKPGGPAWKAGLMAGDRVICIDSTSIVGTKAKSLATKLLKGEKMSRVNLLVKRQGVDSVMNVAITRNDVKVYSVAGAYMIDSTTAYVKISVFGDSVYTEFMRKLRPMSQLGISNLIVDLRGNGGGRVEQVKKIVGEILSLNDTMAFTMNRDGRVEDYFIDTTRNGICRNMRIACLVNTSTASASEIMAGALQDNDRGIIVGRRTYGKGLVQTPIELNDGSVVKLTTYRYYTPSGRSLQKAYDEYKNDYQNRKASGELDSANAYTVKDSSEYKTRNGRIVYSKCGIIPDVFVPEYTMSATRIYRQMDSASICIRFAVDRYIEALHDNSTGNTQYISDMLSNRKATIDALVNLAHSQGIAINTRRDRKEIELWQDRWMAEIAGYSFHIWGLDDEYLRYQNHADSDISEAMATMRNDSLFNNILNNF